MLTVSGTGTAAVGGDRSPKLGRKSKFGHSPESIEAKGLSSEVSSDVYTPRPLTASA